MGQNIHRMRAGAKAPDLTPTAPLADMGSMLGKIQLHQGTEKVAIVVAKVKRNPTTTAGVSRNRKGNGLSRGEMGCSSDQYLYDLDREIQGLLKFPEL